MPFWQNKLKIISKAWQKFLCPQEETTDLHTYHFADDLVNSLNELARREGHPPDQIATELLAEALVRRKQAENNLYYWQALSQREQQISALVCLNLTNQEIASQLGISSETVKSHIQNIFTKFGLHRRSDLRLALADWDFSKYN